MAVQKSSRAIPSGETISTSLNTSTETMVPDWPPATRPAGPDLSPNSSSFTESLIPSEPWKWASGPGSLRYAKKREQQRPLRRSEANASTHCAKDGRNHFKIRLTTRGCYAIVILFSEQQGGFRGEIKYVFGTTFLP